MAHPSEDQALIDPGYYWVKYTKEGIDQWEPAAFYGDLRDGAPEIKIFWDDYNLPIAYFEIGPKLQPPEDE